MRKYLILTAFVGLLGSAGASAQVAEIPDFLIFRTGAAVPGRIVREGDWYTLRSLNGQGESRYPVQSVLAVCHGAEETYRYLLTRIDQDRVEHRCLLARFCVAQGLSKEARQEIQAALQLDRNCSEARSLLAQLNNQPKPSEASIPELPSAPIEPLPAARLDAWPQVATQAGFADFTRRIQPILLNGCGTSACHGVAEGKRAWLLTRGLYGASPSPLVSRANLERVLGLIDKEHPEESQLLQRALHLHGGAKSAPLIASDQATYQQLRDWVFQCCGEKTPNSAKQPTLVQAGGTSGFANNDTTQQVTTASAINNGATFASPTQETVKPASYTPASRSVEKPQLPSIPGVSSPTSAEVSAPNASETINTPAPVKQSQPASSRLPQIPGLSGNASNQMGQPKPTPPSGSRSQSIPGSTVPAPPRNLRDDPEFQAFSRELGIKPTIPNPTQEPPKNIHVKNAGSFQVSLPPRPVIPEEMKKQPISPEAASGDAATDARFLRTGTVVNPPKQ